MPDQTGPKTASHNFTNGASRPPIQLIESLVNQYQPSNPHEESLVEDLAQGRWILWCRQRTFHLIESDVYGTQPDQSKWSPADFRRLILADGYRTRAERTFQRALKNVEAFRKERLSNFRWEAMYDLAVRRLELQKKRHELAVANAAARERRLLLHGQKVGPGETEPEERILTA